MLPQQRSTASKLPCATKAVYRTSSEALVTATRKVGRHNASMLRAYRCQWCAKWHLTSQPKRSGA